MRIGNFLFAEGRDPARDAQGIAETLAEAKLSDELGVDVIWLAEHHFDGNCVYVDPVSFAAALAVATRRAKIGFAVAQVSLHHPIRLAEQLSLIDNLSQGRLVVGLGKGTAYNIYEYQGYGIDHEEAQARYEEADAILFKAWTSEGFEHHGTFWDLKVPVLRPRPYTKPHPYAIRAASGEATMIELARKGEPFLMNLQPDAVTRHRLDLYRRTMAEAGFDDARIAANLRDCWVWRNVFVAETDAEAERLGVPAFLSMQAQRAAMRNRVKAEQGVSMVSHSNATGPLPTQIDATQGLICGSPATVLERMRALDAMGVGGVIVTFRLGPMEHSVAMNSLRLFMEQVAPKLG